MFPQQYQHKTDPFEHQRELFERTCKRTAWGLLWEQGCGKTKPIIDTCAYLYKADEIDCLLVVAPPGVHRNWITDELPKHMPDDILEHAGMFYYQTSKRSTKAHQAAEKRAIFCQGLSVVTISYEAFITEAGKKFVWKVLRHRRCLYVLDEAHNIKTPGAKRTKSIIASGKYAKHRRIATGTPISTGPFDIYSQIRFLDEGFWRDRGIASTFSEFKHHFGVWYTRAEAQAEKGYDPGYDKLVEYKNLDQLEQLIKEICSRLTKEEAGLNLPPKLYSKRYFDMEPAQAAAYEQLKEEYVLQLEDGSEVDADLAIVRLLRLQQISCGYVATDREQPVKRVGKRNPRLELLEEICSGLTRPALIWSRFRPDIDQIMEVLGKNAVRYDGAISEDEAERNKNRFKGGEVQFFVGNQQKGGTGLTLNEAKHCIYYANSFKLIDRLQSEDRPHRIGQHDPVDYTDIIGNGTVDWHIVNALRTHFDVARQITGDKLREWL